MKNSSHLYRAITKNHSATILDGFFIGHTKLRARKDLKLASNLSET